jgi:Epoxide hydrolase N terminus
VFGRAQRLGLITAEGECGGYGLADLVPFTTDVPKEQLDDLQRRLARARWPERETVQDFSQGIQLSRVKRLVENLANRIRLATVRSDAKRFRPIPDRDRRTEHPFSPCSFHA